jgi:uroporphyrinogen III methyltransferase/synthase
MADRGRVLLVGAGPGDPDLITIRGAKALARADVVLYDELATGDLLDLAPARAERINVGKRGHEEPTRSQSEINALLVEHARRGRTVVRLKGGDPFVFGRGGEEVSACAEAGIPFEIVPGVSSSLAAATYAGIPVTDRRHSASFAVVTGHKDPSRPAQQTRWRELATAVDTLVILMGMRNLEKLVAELIAGGKSGTTPAAAIMHGTLPEQRTCVSTLAGLPEAVQRAALGSPSVVIIGDVVGLREGLSWWETQPMFGRRVLVTRARQQAEELAGALRATGAVPVVMPMIELAPIDSGEGVAEIDRALASAERYSSLVFTSSNAVRFFASALEATRGTTGAALASNLRVFCIGDATARAALEAGLPVHLVASGRGDAEALLAQLLPALGGGHERVLIPRSQIGRTVIADGLREAGAEVDSIAFYENRRPHIEEAELRTQLISGAFDALTFTSPSTVDHFLACLDDESRAAAGHCMIAAIGRTTARRLDAVGLPATVVPERPEVSAMIEELVAASWPARVDQNGQGVAKKSPTGEDE